MVTLEEVMMGVENVFKAFLSVEEGDVADLAVRLGASRRVNKLLQVSSAIAEPDKMNVVGVVQIALQDGTSEKRPQILAALH